MPARVARVTTPEQDRIDRYAALVVRVGANVQPGQQVLVAADVAHAAVARAVAEQAYLAGASRVSVEYSDPYVRRSALRHAPAEGLTAASRWELDRLDEWAESGLALVRLTGNPDPHVFDGIDPSRLVLSSAELAAKFRQRAAVRRRAVDRRRVPQRGLGRAGLRRARPGPAVGGRRDRDAARRRRRRRRGGGVAARTATCSAPAPRR